jgi:hypothetical protein
VDEPCLGDIEAVDAVEIHGNEVTAEHVQVPLAETVNVATRAKEAPADFRRSRKRSQGRLRAEQGEGQGLHHAAGGAQLSAKGAVAARALGDIELDLEMDVAAETGSVVLGVGHRPTLLGLDDSSLSVIASAARIHESRYLDAASGAAPERC